MYLSPVEINLPNRTHHPSPTLFWASNSAAGFLLLLLSLGPQGHSPSLFSSLHGLALFSPPHLVSLLSLILTTNLWTKPSSRLLEHSLYTGADEKYKLIIFSKLSAFKTIHVTTCLYSSILISPSRQVAILICSLTRFILTSLPLWALFSHLNYSCLLYMLMSSPSILQVLLHETSLSTIIYCIS